MGVTGDNNIIMITNVLPIEQSVDDLENIKDNEIIKIIKMSTKKKNIEITSPPPIVKKESDELSITNEINSIESLENGCIFTDKRCPGHELDKKKLPNVDECIEWCNN